jgi:hypothetical protein
MGGPEKLARQRLELKEMNMELESLRRETKE